MASSKASTSEDLDDTICQQMSSLVELLTTSGKPVLIPEVMKKFKRICRTSDAYVRHAYDLLMVQLVKDHAEIRLSTFQMIDELFNRSHAFRELIVEDFQTLLELAVEIDSDCPLPPPKQAATTLKNEAYKCIQQWYEKFGEAYKKLALGYHYLKSCKKVNFDAVSARIALERRQKEETERKLEENRLMNLEKVHVEQTDLSPDIDLCLKEIENCIQLLLPHPDMFFIPESEIPGEPAGLNDKPSAAGLRSDRDKSVDSSAVTSELRVNSNAANSGLGDTLQTDATNNSNSGTNSYVASSSSRDPSDRISRSQEKCEKCHSSHGNLSTEVDGKKREDVTVKVQIKSGKKSNADENACLCVKDGACKTSCEDTGTGTNNEVQNENVKTAVKASSETSQSQSRQKSDNTEITEGSIASDGTSQSEKSKKSDNSEITEGSIEPSVISLLSHPVLETTKKCEKNENAETTKMCDKTESAEDGLKSHSEEEEEESEESDSDFEDVDDHSRLAQAYGLGSRNYQISVTVGNEDRLQETEDNKDIIHTLKDQYRLVKTKYLGQVKKWLQTLESNCAKQEHIKSTNDLKTRLEEAMKKCIELEVIGNPEKEDQDSDSDDDFEEVVEKEGYEEDVPEHVRLQAASGNPVPSTSKQSGSKSKQSRSKSNTSRLKALANKAISGQQKSSMNKLVSSTGQSMPHMQQKPSLVKTTSEISQGSVSTQQKTSLKKSASVTSPGIKGKTTPSYWSLNCRLQEEDVKDPASWKSNVTKLMDKIQAASTEPTVTIKQEPSTDLSPPADPQKKGLLEKAPVIPFGVDLEHWENPDKIEAPLAVKYEDARRFWTSSDEVEKDPTQEIVALTTRTMSYTGKFEPVKWKCRAPLPSGKLCERMDREKCPFHGKIIGRDETGMPTDPADIARIVKTEAEDITEIPMNMTEPEEQYDPHRDFDPDLGSLRSKVKDKGKEKGKGKGKVKAKKRMYPNLTDTTEATNASRNRLEAKIFKKSTMKRVNADMDRIDFKKVRDKFGNQFNYSLH